MLTEPDDLDDLTPAAALEAVIADIDTHPVQPGPGSTGLFTATRHIDLLSHPARRLAGDAYHHVEAARATPGRLRADGRPAGHGCRPITQALQHYVQPLAPLSDPRVLSFPADCPWAGNKGQQFSQIGNAVPPRLAAHLLAPHLNKTLGPDDFGLAT
ncbi:hypothetical protein AN219_22720 [Streptomyces nanshensis]|nr:hypothetical protein AN219_22720 [Streptomyces nanshensis]